MWKKKLAKPNNARKSASTIDKSLMAARCRETGHEGINEIRKKFS